MDKVTICTVSGCDINILKHGSQTILKFKSQIYFFFLRISSQSICISSSLNFLAGYFCYTKLSDPYTKTTTDPCSSLEEYLKNSTPIYCCEGLQSAVLIFLLDRTAWHLFSATHFKIISNTEAILLHCRSFCNGKWKLHS